MIEVINWSWQLGRWIYWSLRKPKIRAIVEVAIGAQAQDAEQVLQSILAMRAGPSAATGGGLDLWGKVFKEPRAGRGDAEYAAALEAAVLLDRASGTPEEIVALVAALVPGARVALVEAFPAKIGVWIQGSIPDGARAALRGLVQTIKPGGVAVMAVVDQGSGEYFGWDGDPESGGWGTLADPAVGGAWSNLV